MGRIVGRLVGCSEGEEVGSCEGVTVGEPDVGVAVG